MGITEILFVINILLLQFVLIGLFFFRQINAGIQKTLTRRILTFFSIEFFCIFLVFLGGYLENQQKLYTNLRKPIDDSRVTFPESVIIDGDPSLVQWVEQQRPSLSRPKFTDSQDFLYWQAALRQALQSIFGISNISIPVAIDFQINTTATVVSGVTRVFLTFRSFDGTTIPAYLFMPSSDGPRPAIIVLPGHVGVYEQGITQTAGIVESYQHGAALQLAKAGFITLTIEYRGFGYLGRKFDTEHKIVAHNAILGGSFYKAILSKDIKYALDTLQSLPEVDAKRIGITGVSFGGEMAVTYAALDERVKVVVSQGFGGSIGIEKAIIGKDTEQPHYCHSIPGINMLFFQEDLYYLIAPRPLLGLFGDRDYLGNLTSFSGTIEKAYVTLNASSVVEFKILHGGHEYFVEPAIAFFKQYL